MKTKDENILVAPCGLYCGLCTEYRAQECPGCREIKGQCPVIEGICETYTCANNHKIELCFECSEFPCNKLHPAADMASVIPHNVKLFNLCYIRKYGLHDWLEKASEIRQTYFAGKMKIGRGPRIE